MRACVLSAMLELGARFSDDAPGDLAQRLLRDEGVLRKRYSAFDAWPADGQVGLHTMAIVLGPGFALAGFRRAVDAAVPDFDQAAEHCAIPDGGMTVAVLNARNERLFRNAAVVLRRNLDPELLYFPQDLGVVR